MQYLNKIGIKSKKAFKSLQGVNHKRIKSVLEDYCKNIAENKRKLIKENLKDVRGVKRKHLVDRLILNEKRIDGIRNSINQIDKFCKL